MDWLEDGAVGVGGVSAAELVGEELVLEPEGAITQSLLMEESLVEGRVRSTNYATSTGMNLNLI